MSRNDRHCAGLETRTTADLEIGGTGQVGGTWQKGGTKASGRWLRAGALCALVAACSLPAAASLGDKVSSVEQDRAQMKATIQVTRHATYDVQEMRAPGGTVVDEYVSPDGTVFAVTWHGQFPPPMEQILGSHFAEYTEALQARPQMYGHPPLNIHEPDLVVETAGHMRAYFGRAYIPGLLPQGMAESQLQ